MTISVPLTSSATKHNAVIQCVTRTVALWRGALVRAVTEPTRLRFQTVPAIGPDTSTLNNEDGLMRRPFAGVTRSTAYLALASFFADVSTELLYPVLPVFLTQTLKASGSIVGLVEGVAEATQNIAQGLSGWLADTLRRRKSLALIGYVVAA